MPQLISDPGLPLCIRPQVLLALLEKEDALLLYDDPAGRQERAKLIQANDHKEHPRGLLVYHIELLGLLAQCAAGKPGMLEMRVRDLLPLQEVVTNLMLPELTLHLRAAYLAILDQAWLDTDKPIRGLGVGPELPPLLAHLCAEVEAFARALEEDPLNIDVEDEEQMLRASFLLADPEASGSSSGSLVNSLRLFFDHHCVPVEHTPAAASAHDKDARGSIPAAQTVQQKVTEMGRGLGAALLVLQDNVQLQRGLPQSAVEPCLKVLSRHGLVTLPASTLATTASCIDMKVNGQQVEEHPQEGLLPFMDYFATAVGAKRDIERMVEYFRNGLDEKLENGSVPVSGRECTRRLVEQLRDGGASDGVRLDAVAIDQAESALRVLTTLLEEAASQGGSLLRRRQLLLSEMGATRVALSMAACEEDVLCVAGLRLAIELLRGGNSEVQATFFELLTSRGSLRPFDGTDHAGGASAFVSAMRARLKLAVKEIPERKHYQMQEKELLDNFEETAKDLNPATRVKIRAELQRGFQSRGYTLEVLEVLRLLCEGHNVKMQDYLSEQSSASLSHEDNVASIDLCAEVYDLLHALEAGVDETNVDYLALEEQLVKVLETLTEFVQGNTTRRVVKLLLETKLLECAASPR